MKFWALIADNTVTAMTFQELMPTIDVIGNWVEAPDQYVAIGSAYTGGDFVSSRPVVVTPPIPVTIRLITPYAFKARMTAAERIAVRAAAVTTPAIHDYMDLLDSVRQVDLDHADTVAGTQALEAGGLLAAGRAAAILGATVLDGERP